MRQYVPGEALGWNVQDTVEVFDRATIFDYINGAGEVFLAYDFHRVIVLRFTRAGEPDVTVELFDMGSSEDAYGVFSHARESEETGIGQGFEFRGSLLCFWKSRYFVCVMAESDGDEARTVVYSLAREIDSRIRVSGNRPTLIDILPADQMIPASIRFFHLHSSLNYHYFLAEQNILGLDRETRAVLATYRPGSMSLLCIQYSTDESALKGYKGFIEHYLPDAGSNGTALTEQVKWVATGCVREYVVIVLDASTEESAVSLRKNVIDRLSVESH